MRAVVQRVARASVEVGGEIISSIERGVLVLVGVAAGDDARQARWLAGKVAALRIFPDEAGAMNRSIVEAGGAALVVSQFTLLGDARRGRRPSFIHAAEPAEAEALCDLVAASLREAGLTVEQGRFGAHMRVALVNDGPVTILLDSTKLF